jgi:hypothetical protein
MLESIEKVTGLRLAPEEINKCLHIGNYSSPLYEQSRNLKKANLLYVMEKILSRRTMFRNKVIQRDKMNKLAFVLYIQTFKH